jgi:tRNA 2-thiocytidine biosynthesis protein TtcA
VRRKLRDLFAELEREHPNLRETMLSAMGNLQPDRLLDPRYLGREEAAPRRAGELFPIFTET